MYPKLLLIALTFFLLEANTSFSQELNSYVLSSEDSTAIVGASVYFDGTTIGTTTNEHGLFSLSLTNEMTSPLVISSIGFKTLVIGSNRYNAVPIKSIYLSRQAESLETVVIEADPWTREKKLRIFKNEFLGKTEAASKCRIKNKEVVKLKYSPSQETLTAYADEPLIIKNRYLGYEVSYTLKDFEVKFELTDSGLRFTNLVYVEGLSFFSELRKRTRKKIKENRDESYFGSALHFMRALSNKELSEQKFQLFYDGFIVPPYKYFNIEKKEKLTEVKLLADKLSILYKGFQQSEFMANSVFYIDAFGNHNPPNAITFGGGISKQRIAELLPLNYKK